MSPQKEKKQEKEEIQSPILDEDKLLQEASNIGKFLKSILSLNIDSFYL